jgi:predicted nucleic acid-binding protein
VVRNEGWATCSVTQGGLVRVLSTPALNTNLRPAAALRLLEASVVDPYHQFWADTPGFLSLVAPFADRLRGHRQPTDACLLTLKHDGRLATLDSGIMTLAHASPPFQRDFHHLVIGEQPNFKAALPSEVSLHH